MPPRLKQCYYETLCVNKDATDDDLKKSYRRLALRLHPDKNLDNVEEATEQFMIVQQAYEVLSDSQERAWYDKHRDAILRGGCGFGDGYQDDCLDLIPYCTAACYSGYSDNENGFFSIYRQIFETLSKEEYDFADSESDLNLPQFGTSESEETEFMAFYNYWQSFCTKRSYAWKDEYDLREAPNRRIRRLMEADNKKLRDAARKERNEDVRALIAFIKKRDPRVKAYKKRLDEKAEEVKRRTTERRKQDLEERQKLLETYQESAWSSKTVIENDLQELEANLAEEFADEIDDSENSELDEDDLFCIACNKSFKTTKARLNHEKSKKHKENITALKLEMEEDDLKHFDSEEGASDVERKIVETETQVTNSEEEDEIAPLSTSVKSSKKNKKQRRKQPTLDEFDAQEESDLTARTDSNFEGILYGKDSDEDNNIRETKSKKKKKKIKQIRQEPAEQLEQATSMTDNLDAEMERLVIENGECDTTVSNGKKTEAAESPKPPKSGVDKQTLICAACREKFRSKNKLFQHLGETGHAVLPTDLNTLNHAVGSKISKKKGRK